MFPPPSTFSRAPKSTLTLLFQARGNATLRQRPSIPPITETTRAESTRKRFWKNVGIAERGSDFTITLDDRPLKTPSGNILLLPKNKHLLATLIAAEWEQQHQEVLLKPHALPMTSLASRALDALTDESTRADVRASVLQYLDTDAICFFQPDPPPLVKLQAKHWDPILHWARTTFGIQIHTSDSIILSPQPDNTKLKIDAVLAGFDHWEMTAIEHATTTTKSLLIALGLVKGRLSIEEAARSAQVEVASQIERWGEVEDSHDMDFHNIRRQLGSAACLLSHT